MSLKKMNNAERIIPTPILKSVKVKMEYSSKKKLHRNVIPSAAAKTKKTTRVKPKFITAETFWESKNRYFGTLILEKIWAFATSEFIPPLVDSLKYEFTRLPAKRYVV